MEEPWGPGDTTNASTKGKDTECNPFNQIRKRGRKARAGIIQLSCGGAGGIKGVQGGEKKNRLATKVIEILWGGRQKGKRSPKLGFGLEALGSSQVHI